MWKILKMILVLLCMLQIFLFSADSADESDEKSNRVIIWIAERMVGQPLNEEERQEKIEEYVVFVRKGAHVCVYLLLGFLMLSLIREYKVLDWRMMFLAFILSFFYACSDEIHQLFVPGRSGSIIDVGIDSIGVYFGVLLYYGYYRIRRKYE